MERITQRFSLSAQLQRAHHKRGRIASISPTVQRIAAPVFRPVALLLILAFVFTTSLVHGQTTSSGTATARFNKDVSVSAVGETVQLKDAVAVTYTLTSTESGTHITLLCHYNGTGNGETSGRSYTLIGTDQQTGTISSSMPSPVVISSSATLMQADSTTSVTVRIDYLLTITEDGDLIISITNVEVAQ
jgi:hypothetical protein